MCWLKSSHVLSWFYLGLLVKCWTACMNSGLRRWLFLCSSWSNWSKEWLRTLLAGFFFGSCGWCTFFLVSQGSLGFGMLLSQWAFFWQGRPVGVGVGGLLQVFGSWRAILLPRMGILTWRWRMNAFSCSLQVITNMSCGTGLNWTGSCWDEVDTCGCRSFAEVSGLGLVLLDCYVISWLTTSMALEMIWTSCSMRGSSGNPSRTFCRTFSPISSMRRQFHSHHARQYCRFFFLYRAYSCFSFWKSSKKATCSAVISCSGMKNESSSCSPAVTCTNSENRKYAISSTSRNSHHVVDRSKRNLQNTSWLIRSPSSLYDGCDSNSFKKYSQSSFVRIGSNGNSARSSSISSWCSVRLLVSQQSEISLIQSFRAETNALERSNLMRSAFWSLMLNSTKRMKVMETLLMVWFMTLHQSSTISRKRGWQKRASLRSMSQRGCCFLMGWGWCCCWEGSDDCCVSCSTMGWSSYTMVCCCCCCCCSGCMVSSLFSSWMEESCWLSEDLDCLVMEWDSWMSLRKP